MRQSGTILIVDDEPSLLKMMNAYLERVGYTVTALCTTEAAWQEVEGGPSRFDLALIDASMEGKPIPELARHLLLANPAMTVIATSGYPVDMAALEEAAPGRVAFLLKPFTPAALAQAVRRMIGAQEKEL